LGTRVTAGTLSSALRGGVELAFLTTDNSHPNQTATFQIFQDVTKGQNYFFRLLLEQLYPWCFCVASVEFILML
jgi:hypothetical protein